MVALHRGTPVLCLLFIVRRMVLMLLEGILVAMVAMSLGRGVSRSSRGREVCEVHVQQVRSSALARGGGGSRVWPAAVAVVVVMVTVPRGRSNGLEGVGALSTTTADAAHLPLALEQTHITVLHLVKHGGQALRILIEREQRLHALRPKMNRSRQ